MGRNFAIDETSTEPYLKMVNIKFALLVVMFAQCIMSLPVEEVKAVEEKVPHVAESSAIEDLVPAPYYYGGYGAYGYPHSYYHRRPFYGGYGGYGGYRRYH